MSFFVAKNIHKTYGTFTLDCNLEVEENSFTCILGPSGSGKSTLLKIISGLEKNDSKDLQVFLDGKDITKTAVGKKNIGYIFQSNSLFQNMNVEENIAFGLVCKGENKKTALKKVHSILEEFNLSGFEKRSVQNLSGGEIQRVSLARTLICHPKLILFDEPLSALDESLRKKAAEKIKEYQKKYNFTAIMITHNLDEARYLSDKVYVLKNGSFIWNGKMNDFSASILD